MNVSHTLYTVYVYRISSLKNENSQGHSPQFEINKLCIKIRSSQHPPIINQVYVYVYVQCIQVAMCLSLYICLQNICNLLLGWQSITSNITLIPWPSIQWYLQIYTISNHPQIHLNTSRYTWIPLDTLDTPIQSQLHPIYTLDIP